MVKSFRVSRITGRRGSRSDKISQKNTQKQEYDQSYHVETFKDECGRASGHVSSFVRVQFCYANVIGLKINRKPVYVDLEMTNRQYVQDSDLCLNMGSVWTKKRPSHAYGRQIFWSNLNVSGLWASKFFSGPLLYPYLSGLALEFKTNRSISPGPVKYL